MLEKIAGVLKVPVDALNNFDEEAAINVMSNTFNDSSVLNANYKPTFNPIDKVVELYERMLRDKQEMIEQLKAVIDTLKK